MSDATENTMHVKIAEDYKANAVHVVLYDEDTIHPDTPVFIKSNSKGTFHVSKTTQVMRLIRDGVLERSSAPKVEAEQTTEGPVSGAPPASEPEAEQTTKEPVSEAPPEPEAKRRGRPPKSPK